ncbi:MAG: hypothetical protein WC807_04185 [Hyphomicrobium sp.]|jgi:hypothetical protein
MATQINPAIGERSSMGKPIRPDDLNEILAEAEAKKMEDERRLKEKKEREQRALAEDFMAREIKPDAIDRLNEAVSRAASLGHKQLQLFTFPASFCNDGGRRINNMLPDWPTSLEGIAKKAYAYYERELKPLGYKMTAEVISFPGGVPGEIALYLKW